MKLHVLNQIHQAGVIAIIRADQPTGLQQAAAAIHAGGLDVLEVTMTTPGALDVIRQLAAEMGDQLCLGVGSVLDAETARMAILAGARFLVTPVVDVDVIRMGNRYGVPVMMGCYTPSEIKFAWEQGADVIKLFPASQGGIPYLKAVRAPLPQVQIVPTGGVTLENAADWLAAGVFGLGVGSALVNTQRIQAGDYDEITQRAAAFRQIIDTHQN